MILLKKIDYMKSNANQMYLKQAKKLIKMWCPYITKKINRKKIICAITILGGLSVFSPIVLLVWKLHLSYF